MNKFIVPMIVVLAFVIAACASAQGDWADRVSMSGYLQFRYDGGDRLPTTQDEFEDFSLRRAFFNLAASAGDRTNVVLTLASFDRLEDVAALGYTSDDLIIYNLFVDYNINDQWSARFGQVPTYFGLEAWQQSCDRLALERAMILEGDWGANNASGFYFLGPSDRGLWLKRAGEENQPDIYLGVYNGQGRASDVDSSKNYSVDLKWEREWGIAGLSWFDGALTGPAGKNSRHAVDAYVKFIRSPWDVQAEWADGRMFGSDRDGWYIQVAKVREDKTWIPYLKYEEFSSDGAGGLDYDAIRAGVAWQLDDNNEVTLEVADVDYTPAGGATQEAVKFGLSWQVGF